MDLWQALMDKQRAAATNCADMLDETALLIIAGFKEYFNSKVSKSFSEFMREAC